MIDKVIGRRVFVGVPALAWDLNVSLATFLYGLPSRSAQHGCEFALCVVPGVSPVHYARNLLVGAFLGNPSADRLWFIDGDMVPDDRSLSILNADADVVSGRSLAIQTPSGGLPQLTVAAFSRPKPERGSFVNFERGVDEPKPMVAAGAGNLLIRRRVLEDPRMRLAPTYEDAAGRSRSLLDDPDEAPAVFRTLQAPNGRLVLSEDIDFVRRACELGYSCVFQPSARMGHFKRVNLETIETMLDEQARRLLARERSVEAAS